MLEIKKFTTKKDSLFKIALAIRIKVFVEEQGVSQELEEDIYEDDCTHFIVMKNEVAIATARYRKTDEGVKIERIAVLKDYRDLSIGSYLLKHLLEETKTFGRNIYLHSQTIAVRFYEKYGFSPIGNPFIEDGIEHIKMIKPFSK